MWKKELVELLLLKYQEHENLYNVRDPAYLGRVKRSNSLFKISEELKEINKDVSVEAVKKKIHSLRTQYLKESREVGSSKRSGVGVEDVYEPKLWCFDQMEFLKTHCAIRKSESNICKMNESNDSIELEEQPADINTNPKPAPKFNKRKKILMIE
ncbi:uncharacterized protein LOC142232829 [Haematobia irritans]|uniref:uncharacterized protein LOC142232829 n=1 Tax=Haematobia irritans TaxID=7368 RepID=UPI003F4F60AE